MRGYLVISLTVLALTLQATHVSARLPSIRLRVKRMVLRKGSCRQVVMRPVEQRPSSTLSSAAVTHATLTDLSGSYPTSTPTENSPSKSGPSDSSSLTLSNTTRWSWVDPRAVSFGVNLGNWLFLERWMNDQLFAQNAPDAKDQYTFDKILGTSKGPAVLQSHYNSWVTEDDIQTLSDFGVNHLRVPIGYWAFISPIPDDPFVQADQLKQLDRVIGYAAARNMSVLIDLHSMPGLESGWQSGGRVTDDSNVRFYDADMQQYNDATIAAVLKYIYQQPQRDTISGIGLVNEPTVFKNTAWRKALEAFYKRSYATMDKNDYKVPLIVHHGYQGLSAWKDFTSQYDPRYLIWEDHPYPGTFTNKDSQGDAVLQLVCQSAKGYSDFPNPVSITEWTLNANADGEEFYKQQIAAWSWSGGSFFWSMRVTGQLNWSLLDLIATKKYPARPADQSVAEWAASFKSNCGTRPKYPWESEG